MQDQFVGTMPVSDRNKFDVGNLERYMRQNVKDFSGVLDIQQFKGGQSNPTYRLSAGGQKYVLRRKPPGKLLPSAHAVDREFRVISALEDSDVPVPKTYALCKDDSVIGTMFYIMEHVEGRVFWDQTLPELTKTARHDIYSELNSVIAKLHSVEFKKIGLDDFFINSIKLSNSLLDTLLVALPFRFFFKFFFINLYFPFLNCISLGISTRTGPGLPVVATSKAKCKTLERSLTSFTNQLCFVHGRVIPVVSHS